MSFVGFGSCVFMPKENHITIPTKKLNETVLSTILSVTQKETSKQTNKRKMDSEGT